MNTQLEGHNMSYNIVMFAYNEEANIVQSIESIFNNTDLNLNRFYLIANGCTDNTIDIAQSTKARLKFEKMTIKEITLGDKCNAWNTYIHDFSDQAQTHFFTDADVSFSDNCFSQMNTKLGQAPEETVVIAGMPLSGRNIEFYRELLTQRACFFGNLYGVRQSFIDRIKSANFRLPVGLNWIDSFLTKAVNTDLSFGKDNLPQRTTWLEGVGYTFDSLSFLKKDDIKLYFNRIARYELGKLQEVYLDNLPLAQWPLDMTEINKKIDGTFAQQTEQLSWFKTLLVRRRLNKIMSRYL